MKHVEENYFTLWVDYFTLWELFWIISPYASKQYYFTLWESFWIISPYSENSIISPYERIISPYENYFELFHRIGQNSIISPYENHVELLHAIVKTVQISILSTKIKLRPILNTPALFCCLVFFVSFWGLRWSSITDILCEGLASTLSSWTNNATAKICRNTDEASLYSNPDWMLAVGMFPKHWARAR